MISTDTSTVDNGVNVDALLAAREAMTGAPAAAKFTWKATNTWVNGTHSRTTLHGFFGVGAPQAHKTTFTLETDHPEIFASDDNGVTPVEMVLAGLAGCLTAGVAAVAQNRGVQLRAVTSTLDAQFLSAHLGAHLNGHATIRSERHAPRNAIRREHGAAVLASTAWRWT